MAAQDEDAVEKFEINLHFDINRLQTIHGVRQGDYLRYRMYCGRRLFRLRKSVKLTNGRGRFQKRVLTAELVTSARHLQLALMLAERAWAQAMELKEEAAADADDESTRNPARARLHARSRMRKAAGHAQELAELCAARGSARAALEAECYSAWMAGNLAVEERRWDQGLQSYGRARAIYTQLAKLGQLDDQEVFQKRLADLEPAIRFCQYQAGRQQGGAVGSSELPSTAVPDAALASQLESVLADERQKQAASGAGAGKQSSGALTEVSWLGQRVPVRNDAVRRHLAKARQAASSGATFGQAAARGLESRLEAFENALVSYTDAFESARHQLAQSQQAKSAGKAAASSGKAGALDTALAQLQSYAADQRILTSVERNMTLLDAIQTEVVGGGDGNTGKWTPADAVRVCDLLVADSTDRHDLYSALQQGGDGDGASAAADQALIADEVLRCAAAQVTWKAHREFFVGLGLMTAGQQRFAEASAVLALASGTAQRARSHHEACAKPDAGLFDRVKALDQLIVGRLAESRARGYLATCGSPSSSSSNLQPQSAADGESTSTTADGILSNLNAFDADSVEKKHLIAFPPEFEPVSGKPILFDLALNGVEFPSLDDRKAKKGWLGGWFGR